MKKYTMTFTFCETNEITDRFESDGLEYLKSKLRKQFFHHDGFRGWIRTTDLLDYEFAIIENSTGKDVTEDAVRQMRLFENVR